MAKPTYDHGDYRAPHGPEPHNQDPKHQPPPPPTPEEVISLSEVKAKVAALPESPEKFELLTALNAYENKYGPAVARRVSNVKDTNIPCPACAKSIKVPKLSTIDTNLYKCVECGARYEAQPKSGDDLTMTKVD